MRAFETGNEEWAKRHNAAISIPSGGFEKSITSGFSAWEGYALAHRVRYGAPIGEDYVLGVAWIEWAKALRSLLNGETGRLDCGTLDAWIFAKVKEHGFEGESLE